MWIFLEKIKRGYYYNEGGGNMEIRRYNMAADVSMGYSVSGINEIADDIKNTKEQTIDPLMDNIFKTVESMGTDGWVGSSYNNFKEHMDTFKTTIDTMLANMMDKSSGFTSIANDASQTTTDVDNFINGAF
jgi:uncharacterized protein YukE